MILSPESVYPLSTPKSETNATQEKQVDTIPLRKSRSASRNLWSRVWNPGDQ